MSWGKNESGPYLKFSRFEIQHLYTDHLRQSLIGFMQSILYLGRKWAASDPDPNSLILSCDRFGCSINYNLSSLMLSCENRIKLIKLNKI